MLFRSTRGQAPAVSFKDAIFAGLAPDGGLYMPENWPQFNIDELKGDSYLSLAHKIIKSFSGDTLNDDELSQVLTKAYGKFPQPEIIPISKLDNDLYMMELFHGPSLSFKDVAMQFIGALFDALLKADDRKITILGATSGDTGSAAITAFEGNENSRIVMLHPKGRISEVQRLQMTTVLADNVVNVAIEGDFDQCQSLVKTLMSDSEFNKSNALTTVNSINWARIVAQSVYYAYFSMKYAKGSELVNFVVPSGNFGNAFSAHVARRMGFPVGMVYVATNDNDGLTNLINNGAFTPEKTKETLSPAMDIQWASNYERLIYDLAGEESADLKDYISAYDNNKPFKMTDTLQAKMKQYFSSQTVDEKQTKIMMLDAKKNWQKEIDPHTAVGLSVAMNSLSTNAGPTLSLSTAHACKFPETYEDVTGVSPHGPAYVNELWNKPEKLEFCSADADALKNLMNKGNSE